MRVRDLADEGVEIDTPSGAVTIDQPGSYRVDVDEWDGRTTVTVRSGRAEAITFDATYTVDARQSIVLGDGSPYVLQSALGLDDFEDWSAVRDRRVESSQSVRYVSPSMIGYEDLDEYGTWRDTPGYGEAWYPRTRADWARGTDSVGGRGSTRGAGRGSTMSHGGSHRLTTAAGYTLPAVGRGFPETRWRVPSMPQHSSPSSVVPAGKHLSASARRRLDGSRSARGNRTRPRSAHLRTTCVPVDAPYVDVRVNVDVGSVKYANRDVPGAFTAVPRDAFGRGRPVNSATISVPSDAFRNATPTQAGPGRPSRARFGRRRYARNGAAAGGHHSPRGGEADTCRRHASALQERVAGDGCSADGAGGSCPAAAGTNRTRARCYATGTSRARTQGCAAGTGRARAQDCAAGTSRARAQGCPAGTGNARTEDCAPGTSRARTQDCAAGTSRARAQGCPAGTSHTRPQGSAKGTGRTRAKNCAARKSRPQECAEGTSLTRGQRCAEGESRASDQGCAQGQEGPGHEEGRGEEVGSRSRRQARRRSQPTRSWA